MRRHSNLDYLARVSPQGDAYHPRPSDVKSMRGLPAQGRDRPKKLVQRLRLATINIGTLTGRSRELANALKKRRVDIVCMQETKWKGAKAKDIGVGFKVICNGSSSVRNGVAVVVSEHLWDKVTEVSRLTDCLISIKMVSGEVTTQVISCYTSQTGCTEGEKDQFWESIDAHLRTLALKEHVLLGGDLDGHVSQ